MSIEYIRSLISLTTYPHFYSYTLASEFVFNWLLTGFISILTGYIYNKLIPKEALARRRDNDYAQFENLEENLMTTAEEPVLLNRKKHTIVWYIHSYFSWLAYLNFAAIPVCLSAFMTIPISLSMLLIFVILAIRMKQSFDGSHTIENVLNQTATKSFIKTWLYMYEARRKVLIVAVVTILSIAITMPLVTSKSCINDHVQGYGIPLLHGRVIYSSAFTRFISIPRVCGGDAPCHLYATVPFNTSSSVFINVHTNTKFDTIQVQYDTLNNYDKTGVLSFSESSSVVINSDYDYTGNRNIHSVLLTGLQPDQVYKIDIFYGGKVQASTTYQTLPGMNSTEPYTLIYGGDAGYTPSSQQMSSLVGDKDPRAIIIGGDVAYDDGPSSCYYTVDLFLWQMEKEIFEKIGRLVPMIFAVGNHDVGFNALANVDITVNDNGPSFYTNYPQNLPVNTRGEVETRVPTVSERKSYRAYMIGDVLNVFLDTGYMAYYDGEQLTWLQQISETYKNHPKMAVYHDPIFTPCYVADADRNTTTEGINHWVPVFTKYKFMAAFENHVHAYKRTFAMNGTKISDNGIGIMYLGDGSWGPQTVPCGNQHYIDSKEIYESYGVVNNFWVVEVDPVKKTISHEPVDLNNTAFAPKVTQSILDYADL